MTGRDEILEPKAKQELDKLKMEVANETLGRNMDTEISAGNYEAALDKKKWEAAEALGLKDKIDAEGWENMTTGEVGKIGGKVGGRIGGQMVKELIAMAESQMAPVADEATDKEAVDASSRGR
ncbi:small, acid-soluble spore protein, alpha/beta type [Anaeroselena agilis]|uniref:Small, acid-soluble spore protein, alpha/beta type n=1 Tax=Anaeroselena agilis TaxID=3063788 RepID=A0ABU3NXM3_9FIRM|nr:small, acid-soluble spore protein, alpha/beta type [Selenomonadales bacterium 4137-cl]